MADVMVARVVLVLLEGALCVEPAVTARAPRHSGEDVEERVRGAEKGGGPRSIFVVCVYMVAAHVFLFRNRLVSSAYRRHQEELQA